MSGTARPSRRSPVAEQCGDSGAESRRVYSCSRQQLYSFRPAIENTPSARVIRSSLSTKPLSKTAKGCRAAVPRCPGPGPREETHWSTRWLQAAIAEGVMPRARFPELPGAPRWCRNRGARGRRGETWLLPGPPGCRCAAASPPDPGREGCGAHHGPEGGACPWPERGAGASPDRRCLRQRVPCGCKGQK